MSKDGTTYAERLRDSLHKVDGLDVYPMTVHTFFESMCSVYAHFVMCHYANGFPKCIIGGEEFPEIESREATAMDVLRAAAGKDFLVSGIIGVQFMMFVSWLLDQDAPEDDDEIIWDSPASLFEKMNEWAEMAK